jgi:hypothetical protein
MKFIVDAQLPPLLCKVLEKAGLSAIERHGAWMPLKIPGQKVILKGDNAHPV